MPSRLRLPIACLTGCYLLLSACSGRPDDVSLVAANALPDDAVVTINPADRGISRLEAEDLGVTLASTSAYQQALAGGDFGAATQHFVDSFPDLFGDRDVALTFSLRSSNTDALGMTTVRLDQRYSGLPVFPGELLAHYSGSALVRVIGDYAASIALTSTTPARSESAAFEVAAAAVDGLADCASCSARLGIYRTASSSVQAPPRLVWEVDAGVSQINTWRLRIDAETLAILDKQPLALSAAL